MLDSDPRHGTYAGVQQHRKAGIEVCDDCREAGRIYVKRMKLRVAKGNRTRVPISEEAWNRVQAWNPAQLSRATGMRATSINHIRTRGPEGLILLTTQQRILDATPAFTTIGIRRRIQALAAIGYSAAHVAREVGCSVDAIRRIRRMAREGTFTRHEFGLAVCRAYERLQVKPLPPSKASTRARREAERNGWVSTMGWDDIDHDLAPTDDAPTPFASLQDSYDHAVVTRVLDGGKRDRKLTHAEAAEVVRTLHARGLSSYRIENEYGLKPERYASAA